LAKFGVARAHLALPCNRLRLPPELNKYERAILIIRTIAISPIITTTNGLMLKSLLRLVSSNSRGLATAASEQPSNMCPHPTTRGRRSLRIKPETPSSFHLENLNWRIGWKNKGMLISKHMDVELGHVLGIKKASDSNLGPKYE
jgi:hypothetical protein